MKRIRSGRTQCSRTSMPARLHAKLHGTGDDGRDDLASEHGGQDNLDVVAELEVEGERENWVEKSDTGRSAGSRAARTLIHGDVAPGLEQHHRDGSSGNHISDNQFHDDTVRGDNCQISEPSNDTNISDTHLMPICWFVTAWIKPMGTMYTDTTMRAGMKPHTRNCVGHTSILTIPNTNIVMKITAYRLGHLLVEAS
jgi:hypothetical protein